MISKQKIVIVNLYMEDRIIKIFRRIVKKELKNNLIKIILFGSRARGDNSKYSDYDFIIVVKTCSRDIKDKINYIEGEMLIGRMQL